MRTFTARLIADKALVFCEDGLIRSDALLKAPSVLSHGYEEYDFVVYETATGKVEFRQSNLAPDHSERLRIAGIDAHGAGVNRFDNPHMWEDAKSWGSGWMQAEQAMQEQAA